MQHPRRDSAPDARTPLRSAGENEGSRSGPSSVTVEGAGCLHGFRSRITAFEL